MPRVLLRPLLALPAIGLSLLAVAATAQSRSKSEKAPKAPAVSPLLGKIMPRFELSSWKNGELELPKAANGKIAIVHFFATDSAASESMIPRHNELVDRLGPKGLIFIAIATSESSAESLEAFAKEKGAKYPFARDVKGKTAKAWGIERVPTYAVADGIGRLRAMDMTLDESLVVAEGLLKELEPRGAKH